MKRDVYIDTTIPSYYFDKRESVKFQSKITQKWFKEEADHFNVYLSEITINELNSGNYPNKKKILEFSLQWEILSNDGEVGKIAEIYIQN
ncbi:MAG: hypothetical protein ACE5EA_10690 [Nitrospirota bacterium]